MSSGNCSPGRTSTTAAPARSSARAYRAYVSFSGVGTGVVRAIRGRVIASMLARALEQLDEHPARGARMEEGDLTLDPAAWRAVDELDALSCQTIERTRQISHLEAEVVHRGAPTLGEEPRHAGLGIGRLEQLDARLALRHEDDAHALVGERVLRADGVPQDVAVERDRLAEGRHDDTDVVKCTGVGERGHPRRGSWTPNTPRRSSLISPSVAPARTASSMSGMRFAVPRAAVTTAARARPTAVWSRRARKALTSSERRRASSSSTRRSFIGASSPSV